MLYQNFEIYINMLTIYVHLKNELIIFLVANTAKLYISTRWLNLYFLITLRSLKKQEANSKAPANP